MQKIQEAIRSALTFLQESWQELKKVHWPSRKETYAATVVVLVVVTVVVLFLAVVDYALTRLVRAIVS
jgi:preprotein translocase subunit SecE